MESMRENLEAARTMPDIPDEMERAARDVFRMAYWINVRSIAAEIVADAMEQDRRDDDEWIAERVSESADGSQWAIYTWRAYLVAIVSEHADAWTDFCSMSDLGDNLDAAVCAAAYHAMYADIMGRVRYIIDNQGKD